jgi:uncharacterized protein YbcC (UPF0753/DUF2309 family)
MHDITPAQRNPAQYSDTSLSVNGHADDAALYPRIEAACEQACNTIAPAWPLDRAIAVNPHWQRTSMPVRQVAARMAVLGGLQVFPARSAMQQAWDEGRITPDDLADALASVASAQPLALTPAHCIAALSQPPHLPHLPLLIDVLDDDPARHTRLAWRQAVTHQVSQTCAAYFDKHQADWQPERGQDLYAFWRETLSHDHGISTLMGLPKLNRFLSALPATRQDAERWVLQRLGLPQAVWADYLEAVLLSVNGWASWCAYLRWDANLAGQTDTHIRDLLAIRLAWGVILLESKDDAMTHTAFAALQSAWHDADAYLLLAQERLVVDEVWQVALEVGYQKTLARQLTGVHQQPAVSAPADTPPNDTATTVATPTQTVNQAALREAAVKSIAVQAAFCIDVRSEPIRRALEAADPTIQTIGFAGFFGLPVAYTPLATQARRPQLPGLLAPALEVKDCVSSAAPSTQPGTGVCTANAENNPQHNPENNLEHNAAYQARQHGLARSQQWSAASRWPSAAFSFVEAAGVAYLGKLLQGLRSSNAARGNDDLAGLPARYRPVCRPTLMGLDTDGKVALAAKVLHAMGLDQLVAPLAPLVLLVGHGSQSANNAHAAALDCGACCGQTGEVNARVLAQVLNTPAVRTGLLAKGITIPARTHFVAALHNTTTDEIEGFDLDLLPPAARGQWSHLQQTTFARAGHQVRRERAASLGLKPHATPTQLLTQLRHRANDAAQTRPEWGLAGNASFIIAPRHRTQGLPLNGRSFLHDYDAANDSDGSVLELLMTAPMLVTHWINWQYHASTCDPQRLGSGNKVLHNVVGGHIGVFEGNGGDLRIGLSQQSLHDGTRWVHEPLRLTVVIDAPAAAIQQVIAKHAAVRQLVDNGWLHLWRWDGAHLVRYAAGGWVAVAGKVAGKVG